MAAHLKTLEELVWDQSFLARRHAERLESDPLVDDPGLRSLQEAYKSDPTGLGRRSIALAFERAVTNPVERALYAAAGALERQPADPDRSPAGTTRAGRKTLLERVLENRFVAGRHAWLLAGDSLPEASPFSDSARSSLWARLRELQASYRLADEPGPLFTAERARRIVAGDFAQVVRALHGSGPPGGLA